MMTRLNTDAMTWTALLNKWVEFAQASLALPDDAEGRRWRESVAPIITLQAVRFALDELDRLPRDERSVGLDKAEVLIEQAVAELSETWRGEVLPDMIEEIEEDAIRALEQAEWIGLRELTWRGSKPLVIPVFEIDELLAEIACTDRSILLIAQPGTYIMPGEPFAAWCDVEDEDRIERAMLQRFPESELSSPAVPRQIYQFIDDDGRILGDVIAPLHETFDENALPLLVPLLDGGEVLGSFTLDAEAWEEAQRGQLREGGLEVIDQSEDEREPSNT